jgi:hypothetical protein
LVPQLEGFEDQGVVGPGPRRRPMRMREIMLAIIDQAGRKSTLTRWTEQVEGPAAGGRPGLETGNEKRGYHLPGFSRRRRRAGRRATARHRWRPTRGHEATDARRIRRRRRRDRPQGVRADMMQIDAIIRSRARAASVAHPAGRSAWWTTDVHESRRGNRTWLKSSVECA